MQKIPLTLATPEMILARDIHREDNPAGPPICGKGVKLTASLIERLKKIEVQSVFVEGKLMGQAVSKSPEDLMSDLDKRFSKVEDDPLTARLKNIYRQHYEKVAGV
jgi:hypothetical protein